MTEGAGHASGRSTADSRNRATQEGSVALLSPPASPSKETGGFLDVQRGVVEKRSFILGDQNEALVCLCQP